VRYEWSKNAFLSVSASQRLSVSASQRLSVSASQRLCASAGEKHLVAFTGCSSLAGEEQKKYRAETCLRPKDRQAQRVCLSVKHRQGRGGKKPVSQSQETKYLLLLGKDLGFVTQEYCACLSDRCDNVGKLLNALINSLKAKE